MTRSPDPPIRSYRMPAEWEPHAATWIAWPHNRLDWPGRFPAIASVYCDIVRWIARGERVNILVNNAAHESGARRALGYAHVPLDNVEFFRWRTDRVWTRDSGPIFVTGEQPPKLAITYWKFNAWAKYPNYRHDGKLPGLIAKNLKLAAVQPKVTVKGKSRRLVLEGGSIDVNGRGTLLTTEECLLSDVQARNPGVSREELERIFAEHLGIRKTIWLGNGIVGDDTHGHVDDIARFVSPDTVVAAVEKNASDPNRALLEENLRRLRAATDQDGRKLQVLELPLPAPVWYRGERLPASYANFYIANDAVLVPVFNDPNDRHALNLLAELFPNREIAPVYCGDFIWGLGAVHCATQQQPRV